MSIKLQHKQEHVDGVLTENNYWVMKYRKDFDGHEKCIDCLDFTPKELLELKAELEKIKLEHE